MRDEKLTDIPNVGKRVEKDLLVLGIRKISDLKKKDPYKMYLDLCRKTKVRHDPCLLDVFMAVVDYANGAPKTPWWFYTPERKRKYPDLKFVLK